LQHITVAATPPDAKAVAAVKIAANFDKSALWFFQLSNNEFAKTIDQVFLMTTCSISSYCTTKRASSGPPLEIRPLRCLPEDNFALMAVRNLFIELSHSTGARSSRAYVFVTGRRQARTSDAKTKKEPVEMSVSLNYLQHDLAP
jgi:hypothetical protein